MAAMQNVGVLQQIHSTKSLGYVTGVSKCHNAGYMECGLKHITCYVKTRIASWAISYNPPPVRDARSAHICETRRIEATLGTAVSANIIVYPLRGTQLQTCQHFISEMLNDFGIQHQQEACRPIKLALVLAVL